jgi:hypothetical protein
LPPCFAIVLSPGFLFRPGDSHTFWPFSWVAGHRHGSWQRNLKRYWDLFPSPIGDQWTRLPGWDSEYLPTVEEQEALRKNHVEVDLLLRRVREDRVPMRPRLVRWPK